MAPAWTLFSHSAARRGLSRFPMARDAHSRSASFRIKREPLEMRSPASDIACWRGFSMRPDPPPLRLCNAPMATMDRRSCRHRPLRSAGKQVCRRQSVRSDHVFPRQRVRGHFGSRIDQSPADRALILSQFILRKSFALEFDDSTAGRNIRIFTDENGDGDVSGSR